MILFSVNLANILLPLPVNPVRQISNQGRSVSKKMSSWVPWVYRRRPQLVDNSTWKKFKCDFNTCESFFFFFSDL